MTGVHPAFTLLTALALGFAWVPVASAQPSNPAQSQNITPQPSPSQAFSSEEIKSFAVASLDVQRINSQFQTQIQEAADPDHKMKIATEAEEKMTEAVEGKGLSIDKYNSIVLAARADENLARQIIDYRQQAQ